MRTATKLSILCVLAIGGVYACSSSSNSPGFGPETGDGGASGDSSSGIGDAASGGDVGAFNNDGSPVGNDGGVSIIYAHTDYDLYSFDPSTDNVSLIGAFQGFSDASADNAITDLAVNANGEIFVNSESVVYQAALPSSGTGNVALTKIKTISGSTGQKFFALAFTPAGVLGAGETLVAGDNKGDLYVIDAASGQTQALGGFGGTYQLSGDLVFYMQNGQPQGLATIRDCPAAKCTTNNDFLAEIDMAALAQAYSSKTPGTLLKKVYGTGTRFGELFGVGAWQDKVYGFSRVQGGDGGAPAQLVAIDGNGNGTSLKTFANITRGWSGAGVTTKAAITIPPPK